MVNGPNGFSIPAIVVYVLNMALVAVLLNGCVDEKAGGPEPGGGATITGTISTATGSSFDRDINDPNAPYSSNDTRETAQDIPNPTTLGGYVNVAGTGPDGRSFEQGDTDDYYRVRLFANQSISLNAPDGGSANGTNRIAMFLLDSVGTTLQHTTGEHQTESISINSDGVYYIRISAISGASNYVLTIGLSAQQQTQPSPQQFSAPTDQPFVPGEVIVQYRHDHSAGPNTASVQTASSIAQSLGLQYKSGSTNRSMLLSIDPVAGPDNAFRVLGVKRLAGAARTEPQRMQDTIDVVKALRKRPDIVSARLNYIRQPSTTVPNDEYYSYQWHFPQINLPQAWDVTKGANTIVAVIDTGVLLNHPDLQGQLIDGYDFIRDPDNAGDGDGIDDNPDDVGDDPNGNSSFHGTHVSGTIAAASDNLNGVAGVAWDAKIMPLRALGRFGGTDYDIEQAVRYAAGLPNDSGTVPPRKADVINLSLGGPSNTTVPPQAFRLAREAGVVIVAAAGNESSSGLNYPASLDGVISVSATTINNTLAGYSNFGATVDIAAPGGSSTDVNGDGYSDGVLSTVGSDANGSIRFGFVFYQGTSMASPHVAGVIALMKSVNPDLTPDDIDRLLANGEMTDDLGDAGRDDKFGYGIVNALRAVNAASGAGNTPIDTLPPVAEVQPAALNFGADTSVLDFVVANGGDGDLNVVQVDDNADWLTATPVDVDANGLGRYTVQVDRQSLPQETQTYSATITVTSSANTVSIPVLMQVYIANFDDNPGFEYVVLRDSNTLAILDKVQARYVNGQYQYEFDNVAPGSYQISASTDTDNDNRVCEVAEACGAYLMPTYIRSVVIGQSGDRAGVDFETGFGNVINANMNQSPASLSGEVLY
ncbi:MAG: S8 family serine peptidase [Gammaproteobacteria bacterium]